MVCFVDPQVATDKVINGVKTSLLFLCQTLFFWGQLDRIDQFPNAIMKRTSKNVRVKFTCVEVILEGMDRIYCVTSPLRLNQQYLMVKIRNGLREALFF